jgi:hypothetical protein
MPLPSISSFIDLCIWFSNSGLTNSSKKKNNFDNMAIEKNINYLCPVCFNLDLDQLTKQNPPCILDEYRITTPFSKMKASAESGDCLACEIICAGLEHMQEQWEESEFLVDGTVLLINLRRGHSLRVILANVGYESTLEFYTLSHEGT